MRRHATPAVLCCAQWELLLWAARRSQVLARNVAGMRCNTTALRALLQLECPKPSSWTEEQYQVGTAGSTAVGA